MVVAWGCASGDELGDDDPHTAWEGDIGADIDPTTLPALASDVPRLEQLMLQEDDRGNRELFRREINVIDGIPDFNHGTDWTEVTDLPAGGSGVFSAVGSYPVSDHSYAQLLVDADPHAQTRIWRRVVRDTGEGVWEPFYMSLPAELAGRPLVAMTSYPWGWDSAQQRFTQMRFSVWTEFDETAESTDVVGWAANADVHNGEPRIVGSLDWSPQTVFQTPAYRSHQQHGGEGEVIDPITAYAVYESIGHLNQATWHSGVRGYGRKLPVVNGEVSNWYVEWNAGRNGSPISPADLNGWINDGLPNGTNPIQGFNYVLIPELFNDGDWEVAVRDVPVPAVGQSMEAEWDVPIWLGLVRIQMGLRYSYDTGTDAGGDYIDIRSIQARGSVDSADLEGLGFGECSSMMFSRTRGSGVDGQDAAGYGVFGTPLNGDLQYASFNPPLRVHIGGPDDAPALIGTNGVADGETPDQCFYEALVAVRRAR